MRTSSDINGDSQKVTVSIEIDIAEFGKNLHRQFIHLIELMQEGKHENAVKIIDLNKKSLEIGVKKLIVEKFKKEISTGI